MRCLLFLLALSACADEPVRSVSQPLVSSLWGESGEAFDPTGRLMDWSYAGYGAGERTIPEVPAVANVADFGALGDGTTDDGDAFAQAIAAAERSGGGAVEVGSGRYLLRRRLDLPTGVVLRGAGRDETVLFFPSPLEALYPGERNWSFSGGFLAATGSTRFPSRTNVVAPASRGTREIEVASPDSLAAGQWILIRQTDAGGTLMRRLHADLMDGGSDNVGDDGLRFPTRITSIEGNRLTLERALPVDVEERWSPRVESFEPRVEEVGVETLTIEFPLTDYPGHFNEEGYNAIHFAAVANAWVRDVTILNADYGVSFTHSFFSTASGVRLATTGSRGDRVGHHGLNNGHGGDNLFVDFAIEARFIHDLTNEWYAHGVVFARGRGFDLCMDHHRAAPYTTLWTELDLGLGERPWQSGGRRDRGPHTAAYDTLWNLRADRPLALPDADYGPRMTFVGFDTEQAIPPGAREWVLEPVAADEIEPANLWEAMRLRRLGPEPMDGGVDAGADASRDGGSADASADASAVRDAGTRDAGTRDAGRDAGSDGGGGCSVNGAPSLSFAFVLAFVLRRRRKAER